MYQLSVFCVSKTVPIEKVISILENTVLVENPVCINDQFSIPSLINEYNFYSSQNGCEWRPILGYYHNLKNNRSFWERKKKDDKQLNKRLLKIKKYLSSKKWQKKLEKYNKESNIKTQRKNKRLNYLSLYSLETPVDETVQEIITRYGLDKIDPEGFDSYDFYDSGNVNVLLEKCSKETERWQKKYTDLKNGLEEFLQITSELKLVCFKTNNDEEIFNVGSTIKSRKLLNVDKITIDDFAYLKFNELVSIIK